jgi:Dyp-type peroxidase family
VSKLKYFEAIDLAQAKTRTQSDPRLEAFDFTAVAPKTRSTQIKAKLAMAALQPIYAIGRAFFPIMKLGGIYHITRDEQVRDVLSRPDEFCVPFGREMAELARGPTFALGLDGAEQAQQNALLRKVINPTKDMATIGRLTREFATALLENSHGKIDAINDLIKGTVSEVCIRYFGFVVDDRDAFADWTISASALLFGDPTGNPKVRKLALNGSARLCAVFDDSIARAQLLADRHQGAMSPADTIVDRLVALQRSQGASDPITNDQIRAILFGLVSGFIPTNTLAAGKMLGILVKRPAAFQSAMLAAQKGPEGREALKKILLEAGRLNPTLSPGQWRYCPKAATLKVGDKVETIPAGAVLMVSTMSAMRDRRVIDSPNDFLPDRKTADGTWQEPDLLFGAGTHHCIGKFLAIEQITETFMVLFAQSGIRPAPGKEGRVHYTGPFCRNLTLEFDTPSARQSMTLVLASVTSGASKAQIDALIGNLGHPATQTVADALTKTGIVHFCSLSTIESDTRIDIVWELSVDGYIPQALATIVGHVGDLVRPIFAHAGLMQDEDLTAFLVNHLVTLHGKPWGATGINFQGTGEFPITAIEKQVRFSAFVEKALADFLSHDANRGSHAMLAIGHVRRILSQDRILMVSGTQAQKALMQESQEQGFDAYQMVPNQTRLNLTKFQELTAGQAGLNFIKSRDSAVIWAPALVFMAIYAGLIAIGIDFRGPTPLFWNVLSLLGGALLSTVLTLMAIPIGFLLAVRRAEKRDLPNDGQASLAHIKSIERNENIPGYAQNHMMAVGTMKPGLLRELAHTLALWGVRVLIESKFRPGFVRNMGTIHYARWWRVPGTNKAAFFSNFDGSWESYLEDFVTRTASGMTAVWSNWQGFPPTKFLILKGVADGGRFKRWVRTQQQAVPFWYSRFPKLTTDHIRNNALIHRGVACAQTNSEAEEWLRCFGSMPRVDNRIETDEVQALVFSGLKRLIFSACLSIELPDAGRPIGAWLTWVRGDTQILDSHSGADSAFSNGLAQSGVIVPVYDRSGKLSGYALASSMTVTFGDRPLVGDGAIYEENGPAIDPSDESQLSQHHAKSDAARMARRAVFLGYSAAGLKKFDAPNMLDGGLCDLFPPAFQLGMAARGRNLGDLGEAGSQNWRWGDAKGAGPSYTPVAEAVFFIYAETQADLEYTTQVHTALLENYGGKILSVTNCAPARLEQGEDQHAFEHFGYRDGISQPVIKATHRARKGVPDRDLVEGGEFILGYANGQGFFSPSPLLPAEADLGRILPQLSSRELSRFPDFGAAGKSQSGRDFGRNGTFLVVRELSQDVEGFEEFVVKKAAEIKANYADIYKVIGQFPDKDWIKAKLMGRWPNGRPLIGNPVNTPSPKSSDPNFAACRAAELENDFTFGGDDPQGLACPFGSHIRRANPRDSKEPGDKSEQIITNRHRLLRRGRTYTRTNNEGETEKGIVFVALCTDIERQFEFVQQVWSNSPSFHGLSNEPDPISGADTPDHMTGLPMPRHFTIPTPAGSMKLGGMESFVKVRAGGYFFLPSRSALTYLTQISLDKKESGDSIKFS